MVMLGTNLPSMTSTWIQSAPALSTACTCGRTVSPQHHHMSKCLPVCKPSIAGERVSRMKSRIIILCRCMPAASMLHQTAACAAGPAFSPARLALQSWQTECCRARAKPSAQHIGEDVSNLVTRAGAWRLPWAHNDIALAEPAWRHWCIGAGSSQDAAVCKARPVCAARTANCTWAGSCLTCRPLRHLPSHTRALPCGQCCGQGSPLRAPGTQQLACFRERAAE